MKKKKRSWADVYNDLLRYQAELSWDLEQIFFLASSSWVDAKVVVDFGSGNSYYTNLLAHYYPEKKFICIEKNKELFNIAEQQITSKNISIVNGSFDNFEKNFDFIFSRHTLSYLSDNERKKFMLWVNKYLSPGGAMLIIDAEDDDFLAIPRLPLLEGGNKKFQEDLHVGGGNRSLREILAQYFLTIPFKHERTRSLVVPSSISGRKFLMSMFMKSVAEIDHGSPLPDDVQNEIDEWARDHQSYLQYGMFGSSYIKES